jgi:hypothetical protein
MATISLVSTFRQQFLHAMVDESPNKHLSLVPAQKSMYIFLNRPQGWPKSELCEHLAAKIRVPKNFKCGGA